MDITTQHHQAQQAAITKLDRCLLELERIGGQRIQTTPGRIIVGELLPEGVPFEAVNTVLNKRSIGKLVGDTYRMSGTKATVVTLLAR